MEEFKKSLKFDPERYKVLISGDRFAILTKKPEDILHTNLFVCVETIPEYKDIFQKTKERIVETKDIHYLYTSTPHLTFKLRQLQINLRSLNSAESLLLTDSIKSKVQSVAKRPFNEITAFCYIEDFGIMHFVCQPPRPWPQTEHTIFIRDNAEYLNFIDCVAKSSGIQSVYCNH